MPTRVMAVGVFDLLHPGHVHYLTEAKKLGDELVVVVATDATVRERKGPPIFDQATRARLVEALKPVDRVVVGHEGDHYKTVEEVRPDVIALGYDQHHQERAIKAELADRGLDRIEVRRMPAFEGEIASSRQVVERILEVGGEKLRRVDAGDDGDDGEASDGGAE